MYPSGAQPTQPPPTHTHVDVCGCDNVTWRLGNKTPTTHSKYDRDNGKRHQKVAAHEAVQSPPVHLDLGAAGQCSDYLDNVHKRCSRMYEQVSQPLHRHKFSIIISLRIPHRHNLPAAAKKYRLFLCCICESPTCQLTYIMMNRTWFRM